MRNSRSWPWIPMEQPVQLESNDSQAGEFNPLGTALIRYASRDCPKVQYVEGVSIASRTRQMASDVHF